MTEDQFEGVPDLVPISAAADDDTEASASEGMLDRGVPGPGEIPPPEGFTPKEILGSVFSAAVQIYNGRKDERDYHGKLEAVKDAATLFAISANKKLMAGMFQDITTEHGHPYDVFERAQMEIEGLYMAPSDS